MESTITCKNARQEQCARAGRNIRIYQERQASLRARISELRDAAYDTELEINDIRQKIDQIAAEQDVVRAVAGRGGLAGTLAGEVGAQIIALARRRGELDRQLEKLQARLSRITGPLQAAETRLRDTERLLSQSHDAFDRLNCSLSDLPF